jgi:hypothetical protein
MNDFEKELEEVLKTKCDIGIHKDDTRRKEIEKMIFDKYANDLSRTKVVFLIFFILCLGMMAGGYIGLLTASNTKSMLLWLIFFMIGFNSTILMKLWYWVVNSKLNILKEMKQLQLQISELAGKGIHDEN